MTNTGHWHEVFEIDNMVDQIRQQVHGYDLEPAMHGGSFKVIKPTYYAARDRIKAYFPKRGRKNPAVCPVTGEDAWHSSGLSLRAWKLLNAGLLWEAQQAAIAAGAEVRKPYIVSHFWLHCDYVPIPHDDNGANVTGGAIASAADMICAMSGQTYNERDDGRLEDLLLLEGIQWLHEKNRIPMNGNRFYMFKLTDRQAAAIRYFGDELLRTMNYLRANALQASQNWLTGMAQGNVGVDDLNRLAAGPKERR